MIRNWLKKIIKEVLLENFPACNITVIDSETSDLKMILKKGTFVNSHIKMYGIDKKKVDVQHCFIQQDEGTFIDVEGVE